MGLSCYCGDEYEYSYVPPKDYSTLNTASRKRCCSCGELIEKLAITAKFKAFRMARSDIEERIYDGDQVPLAHKYMCEKCADLYFIFEDLGYCISLGDSMVDCLEEYHEKVKHANETE